MLRRFTAATLSVVILCGFVLTGCKKKEADLTLLTGKAVVLGDSLWGIDKTDNGIGGQLSAITSLEIKDYTIPGTTATKVQGIYSSQDCMYSILVENDDKRSEEIRSEIATADYVFIEHCNNDYAMEVPPTDENYSYEQALTASIAVIKDLNPDVKIVLIAPTVGYLINTGKLTTEQDFGHGTIQSYIDVMEDVANREGAALIRVDEAWELTSDNWQEYTEDGLHLTKPAKTEYATFLANRLYELFVE